MSLILCIETGTDICSVGLARDGELISLRESDEGRDHAKRLGVFVDELLRETGVMPDELDAVAVGKGPGSYTGLRIGVSFAKGLCYGLQIPLIAVCSLDALAEVAIEDYEAGILDVEAWDEATLCPMVDARRMEVYTCLYNAKGEPQGEVSAEIIDGESFADVHARALEAIAPILTADEDAVCVIHGGVIATLMFTWFPGKSFNDWMIHPGTGWQITVEDGKPVDYRQVPFVPVV